MKKWIFILVFIVMLGWSIIGWAHIEENSSDEEVNTGSAIYPDIEVDESNQSDDVGLEIGDVAPDFELETHDGDTVRLSDFRGERVFLNFWATWCPPCREEIPDLQKLYDNHDVVILAVNMTGTEGDPEGIDAFIEEFEMTFPVLMDRDNKVMTQYRVQAFPTTYLIDSEGVTHFIAPGALNYDFMVQELEKMD